MAKKAKKRTAFPSKVADLSIEQLWEAIDRRIASGEVPWPVAGGPAPWPMPLPMPRPPVFPEPWPPFCPVCGTRNRIPNLEGPASSLAEAQSLMPRLSAVRSGSRTVTSNQIWEELKKALEAWKSRFSDVTQDNKLASMAASGDGRFDVLSAVRRSPFFGSLGLVLHYFQIGGDEDLGDVVETIGKLLEDLGHMVTA